MKTTPLRIILTLGLAILVSPPDSHAYRILKSPKGKWLHWTVNEVGFRVNPGGAPDGTQDAISAALETWSAAGAAFRFGGGDATTRICNSKDRVNVCCFNPLGKDGILAQNRLTYNPGNGGLVDSDISFNSTYPWSVTGEAGKVDVQNIATHELGHALSLADLKGAEDTKKTMYGSARRGETKKRTLHPDDVAGINRLYPP